MAVFIICMTIFITAQILSVRQKFWIQQQEDQDYSRSGRNFQSPQQEDEDQYCRNEPGTSLTLNIAITVDCIILSYIFLYCYFLLLVLQKNG